MVALEEGEDHVMRRIAQAIHRIKILGLTCGSLIMVNRFAASQMGLQHLQCRILSPQIHLQRRKSNICIKVITNGDVMLVAREKTWLTDGQELFR